MLIYYTSLSDRFVHWEEDSGRVRTVFQSTLRNFILPDREFADVCADNDEARIEADTVPPHKQCFELGCLVGQADATGDSLQAKRLSGCYDILYGQLQDPEECKAAEFAFWAGYDLTRFGGPTAEGQVTP